MGQLLLASAAALLDEGLFCADDHEKIELLVSHIRPVVISPNMQTHAEIEAYRERFDFMLVEVVKQLSDKSVIETFLLRVLPELLGQVQEKIALDYTQTLKFVLTKQLVKVAHYLIDNHFCTFHDNPDDEEYTCLIYVLFRTNYEESLFLKILAAEKHLVRHRLISGTNALFMAATYNNAFALKHY